LHKCAILWPNINLRLPIVRVVLFKNKLEDIFFSPLYMDLNNKNKNFKIYFF